MTKNNTYRLLKKWQNCVFKKYYDFEEIEEEFRKRGISLPRDLAGPLPLLAGFIVCERFEKLSLDKNFWTFRGGISLRRKLRKLLKSCR